MTQATITFTVPIARSGSERKPDTIDPATLSISVVVNALAPQIFNVTASTGGCTNGPPITCTETVNAPPGSDTFTATTYSANNAGGFALDQGSKTQTIVASAQNAINVTLGPVVSNNNDAGPGSLRNAIANANAGDTITFILATPATINLLSPITVATNNLTIHGPGSALVTVNSAAAGGFTVNAGVTSTFDHLAFTASAGPCTNGCMFSNVGTLTLDSATFTGGTATNSGGAVYSNGGSLTVTNSTFTGNSAAGTGGGAIDVNAGVASITHDTFTNNSTQAAGGALYLAVTATVDTDTFTNNVAGPNFGFGGAMYANGATQTISNSTFDGNQALSCAACASQGQGGAVYATPSSALTLTNDTMGVTTGNVSQGQDGATGGAVTGYNTITITGGTYKNNLAVTTAGFTSFGGAIYAGGNLSINGGTYANNTAGITSIAGASGAGGAINANGGTITGATFTGNSALGNIPNGGTGNGGAICVAGSFTIDSSVISNNIASSAGAGFYGMGAAADLISRTTVDSNSITGTGVNVIQGAGVYLASGTLLTIDKSTISNNALTASTSASGAGFYNNGGSPTTVQNSTFYGNSSSNLGGNIFNNTTMNIYMSTIVRGTAIAASTSGNVYNVLSVGTITINGDVFAYGNGGATSGINNQFSIVSQDYNDIQGGVTTGGAPSGSTANNIASDPQLAAAAALNGSIYGPFTIATTAGSGALNVVPYGLGCNGTTISTDERGNSRDFGTSHMPNCTMGAFEAP
ncbi:MAG: hypothetical protein JOZ38_10215 [Candidatus Eremiobacteraeota bacterium]|nr:hypothetical protein [Candidatus Eremiobacteraeota bacterium]